MRFYLGSYTRLGGPGIAVCSYEGGRMRALATEALPNATYVILNKSRNRLYAISSEPVARADGGSAAAYAVEGDTLRLLSRRDTVGNGPCHLYLSRDERFLYTANYQGGSLSVFPIEADGSLGPCVQHIEHAGRGPHPTRQTAAHVHQVTFIPGADLLCAVDLGLDAVVTYAQDPQTGLLNPHDRLDVPGGLGPRHLLHGEGGVAWLAHELGSAVSVIRRGGGVWRVEQTISTLPPGYAEETTVAAVRRTKDGKRLLVSNRGHNSIAVFPIGANGELAPPAIYPTGDDLPRDFEIVDDETLIVAHQNGLVHAMRLSEGGLCARDTLDIRAAVCVCLDRA